MDYRIDYTRPMTAEDFRAWRAHVRYDVKKAARHLNVTPQGIAAFEAGTSPIDVIAQDCCRIAEIVEHRRAERRRAAKDEPPFDPDAEPPVDPDSNDPRQYRIPLRVTYEREMTAEDLRSLREHIGYTLHQASVALAEPIERIRLYESGALPIDAMTRGRCRVMEVWEWRKAARKTWRLYWQRRGEPPPAPPASPPSYDWRRTFQDMTADDFRQWQQRRGWNDELVALHLGVTEEVVRAYASGERPIDAITQRSCLSADLPPPPPKRRAPWR